MAYIRRGRNPDVDRQQAMVIAVARAADGLHDIASALERLAFSASMEVARDFLTRGNFTAAFGRNATEVPTLTTREPNEEIANGKQISIALATGLLIVGASVASATEISRSLSSKAMPSSKQGSTYSHAAAEHEDPAACRCPRGDSCCICLM